jgi:FtsP/CotA-like multicopper oxidase with cupredoxin domain
VKNRWLSLAAGLALGVGCSRTTSDRVGPAVSTASAARIGGTSRFAKKAALQAAASNLTDQERRVPHYFGPFPNWANSPLTLPDAQVVITGDGSGATATASVGANGSITAITVTNPGNGYGDARVQILGSGTGATAQARINENGYVTSITLGQPGAGYTTPQVTISGGRGTGATAVAYGGVDAVTVTDGGSGYTFPTVDFDLPDGPDGVAAVGHATMDSSGTITGVVVDSPGSGYSTAPNVVIRNGTMYKSAGQPTAAAIAKATLSLDSIVLTAYGTGYVKPPLVTIADAAGSGTGATATATVQRGGIVDIVVRRPGSGYVTPGGIRKFVDTLPGLGPAAANNLGQYIPVAVPDTTTFPGADYYEIAVVEYAEQMHSDLPPTRLRGYVQVQTPVVTGIGYPLPGGKYGVDRPHYLGPTIVARKDRPVRITFHNLLPTGAAGDLFLPVDSTVMGSGEGMMSAMFDQTPTVGGTVWDSVRNPACTGLSYDETTTTWTVSPKGADCFKDNRATLHLHGGNTPWISDGTPHQWITPANEATPWPEGVSVRSVPDMVGAARPPTVPDCSASTDGCMTFYYTNQQSARLMFYHDHAWGITRLNVYAGEAAGYLIEDDTEKALVSKGLIPSDQIPLVIQDRTFVPQGAQLDRQDPTWDGQRWGGHGNLWYHHVYMPAQNPGDPSGMSAMGRWMYGAWFWPPATDLKYGPIANPYFDASCKLDDPATWQYQTDPFCEPALIPGTPNVSAGMEQFNDTPIVNGTAYPTVTLNAQAHRLRILNAANDRFWNLQWYVADSTGTEVALKAAELAAAQLDPNVFPTPDTAISPAGPSWIQIGTEGGFLPAPAVVPNQPITWITDPSRFDFGNVDQHALTLGPAERADVIVDFSQYAGKTLILYNDAPAAFPARVASYDYYTGAPDLSPVGAPRILPGYGPNTRTIMQVKIASVAGKPFDLAALQAAFRHHADGSGVFESGQPPIIVGQAAYNSAYGTRFAASGWCTSSSSQIGCDGFARISQQGGDLFTFDTLIGDKLSIPLQPKALHDEMNATSFDEFGRMQANLGVEAVPATPSMQNVNLMPYTFPATEVIDTTYLPRSGLRDASGAEIKVAPIAVASDGTQIWKFTHNGVDTHPIHFHAFDVQVLNRVTWDDIIMPPDPNELGWKDTVRISPLEDTIIALRPVIPTLPFELPNSVRPLNPMMPSVAAAPLTSAAQLAAMNDPLNAMTIIASATINDPIGLPIVAAPNGEPIDVYNHLMNFGAEYVYHCHILSHEEMDMMRPVLLALPPRAPTPAFLNGAITWTDDSISETAYAVEKLVDGAWVEVQGSRVSRELKVQNTTGESLGFPLQAPVSGDRYRVVAENTVGDWWDYSQPAGLNEIVSGGFPSVTARSFSAEVSIP